MKIIRKFLSEVVSFQEGPGVRNTQYTSSGVKLLNVSNLVDGEIDLTTSDRYISAEEAYGRYKHFLVNAGDLIIASSGIKVEYFDKKMGFVDKTQLPLCMNTSTIRFKAINSDTLNIRYFMYFLKSKDFKSQLVKQITGSAQLNFGPSHLKKMKIPVLEIEEQSKICAVLDKTSEIIKEKNEKILKLDELIKARFVEMFGDVQYARKYKGIQLRNLCTTVSGGTPSTRFPQYYEGDIPWISTVSLGQNHIDGTSAKGYITREAVANSATKLIPAGNILFGTRVGVGKSSLNDVDICINQDIVAIVGIDETKYSRLFIKHVLDSYQTYFNSIKKGATILGISGEDLKNILIPQVSIELQNQFADFVQQVDKSKDVAENTCNGAILML